MVLAIKNNNSFLLLLFFLLMGFEGQAKIITQKSLALNSSLAKKQKKLEEERIKTSFKKKGEEPVYFKGDSLLILFKDNKTQLDKNVFVRKEDLSLYCDKAFIYSDENKQVKLVEAIGNVHITKKATKEMVKIEGFSKKAFYYPLEERIELIDSAKIIREEDTLEGDVLNYNFLTKELTGQQVQGHLISQKKRNKKVK